jgi:glycosyltransferase involved in cell wall biosynthesis
MNSPELSIVLPCYNESGNIPNILKRYSALLKEIALELILVNNGSTDSSKEIFAEQIKNPEYQFARVVEVPKNIGYGHGIQFGLTYCKAQVIGYSHADLQCPPEDILKAYRLYQNQSIQGKVLVKGRRLERRKDKTFVSAVYNKLSEMVTGYSLGDINGQPKIFPREFLPELICGPHDFSYDLFVLVWVSKKAIPIKEIDVVFETRQFGQSKWAHNRFSKIKTILKSILRLFQIQQGKKWSLS